MFIAVKTTATWSCLVRLPYKVDKIGIETERGSGFG